MNAAAPQRTPSRPLYSPRNPFLRVFLFLVVAGFVAVHESFSGLFKSSAAAPLAPDDSTAGLSHNTIQ